MGIELTGFIGKIDEEFICPICALVLENPVQSTCEHIFCNQCIKEWQKTEKTCPVCRHTVLEENVKPVARYFRNLLDKLEVKCDFESKGCRTILKLENLKDHISYDCVYNPNIEVVCDKGCNSTISRHDYEAYNCFSHLSTALKKLKDKLDEHSKIVNSLRWQICYKMDISINEPNILEYGRRNVAGGLALVQSIRPLAPHSPSFKIEILNEGEDNVIAIGLTRKGYPLNSQPGWLEGSIGYHGDDGKLFDARGIGETFGPKWKTGDIIECLVSFPTFEVYTAPFARNFRNTVEVYFSRNDELIGSRVVKMPELGFFPTVSIRTKGGRVRYLES